MRAEKQLWVVEAANRRVKNAIKFFDQVNPAHYYGKNSRKKLGAYFRIACLILNAFLPRPFLRTMEGQKQKHWKESSAPDLTDFPVLTEGDILDIALKYAMQLHTQASS